jgi:hypothetical protein
MTLRDVWRARQPRSAKIRYLLYAATLTIVILLGVVTVRLLTKKAVDDCNKPAAPVEVPHAPPGLIVDAPCTDGVTTTKPATPRAK